MMKTEETLQPNTTQVPNIILDVWMDRLSDVEFRVLLIITRQTLGWIEDPETGKRKEKDWISMSQLVEKSGRSRKYISKAVKTLVEELHIIEALDSKGKPLNTADKRKYNFGKIFYRLSLKLPEPSLFDRKTLNKATFFRVSKGNTEASRESKGRTTKGNTTKETLLTKEKNTNTLQPAKPAARSEHKEFIEFWHKAVRSCRHMKPIITGADAKNLKRILDLGVDPEELEKLALFFLADPSFKKFSPSISTLTSAGIINGLLNRATNDHEFRRKLEQYADQHFPRMGRSGGMVVSTEGMVSMQDLMKKMLARLEPAAV